MPSPFPGMDPYLENPDHWPGVHARVIPRISDALNRVLGANYYSVIETRVYLARPDDPAWREVVPDARVVRTRRAAGPGRGATAVAARRATAEPVVVVDADREVRERRVHVVERTRRDVVAIIEVLSPANKTTGAAGRREYATKRDAVLASDAHLVEIDLLRAGRPVFGLRDAPAYDYAVYISRAGERPAGRLWPLRLDHELPVVPVPLRAPDPDAGFDLKAILASVYDDGLYDRILDYAKPPVPPLGRPWATWADKLLRAKGLK